MKITELKQYRAYGRCLALSNGKIEAVVTLDVGPRIVFFGFVGGQNIMQGDRDVFERKKDAVFRAYYGAERTYENFGGHRLWVAPESYPESYYPDARKVKWQEKDGAVSFLSPPETENGVQKRLTVFLSENAPEMRVRMEVENVSDAPKTFAVWGVTACNRGGVVVIPMNTRNTGFLPNRLISVWPYADMRDDRIYWGQKYATLRQDSTAETAIKLGFNLEGGKAYCFMGGDVFEMRYAAHHPGGSYPDGGCSFETYTNKDFIEVESLGELREVAPGQVNYHEVTWRMHKLSADIDFRNETSIEEALAKL